MAYEKLIIEKKDYICTITLNNPPVNAWSWAMMVEFEKAINEAEKDKDVRVIILTGGGGRAFSAGLDISDSANLDNLTRKGRELWTRLDRFEKPLIAAINGVALGGGLELALSCHFRLMADDPKITTGLTELNLGLMPGWGGTQRLIKTVGKAKALDMIIFSKQIGAGEAKEIGLVNQTFPKEELMNEAIAFARVLTKRPPIALGCTLKAMSTFEYEGLKAGLKAEEEGSGPITKSEDMKEGFMAFKEKREPIFKGN